MTERPTRAAGRGRALPPAQPPAPTPVGPSRSSRPGLAALLAEQIRLYLELPGSIARLVHAAADAAEAAVGLMQSMDRQAQSSARLMNAVERPLVKLADAADEMLVDQLIEAVGRLPTVLAQANAISGRAENVLASLEAPARALGPLTQALDPATINRLAERLEATAAVMPTLVRLPDTEREMRRLRETLDRLYRVVDDASARFSALPGVGLLRRREDAPGGGSAPPTGMIEESDDRRDGEA